MNTYCFTTLKHHFEGGIDVVYTAAWSVGVLSIGNEHYYTRTDIETNPNKQNKIN